MMKQLLLLFLLLLPGLWLSGQYTTVSAEAYDSLTQLIAKAKTDTARIDLLFTRGVANQFINTQKAYEDLNEALRLARKVNDKDRILGCLVTLGYGYSMTGEPVKSIYLLQEALRYTEDKKDDTSMALAFLANNYEAQGDLQRALDYARQSYQE